MPKAKWLLTARTKNGNPLPKDIDPLGAGHGRNSTSISVYNAADLSRRLREASERTDLAVTVTPLRTQSGPRRSH